MKYKIAIAVGLIGIGAVLGATLDGSKKSDQVKKTAATSKLASPKTTDNIFSVTGELPENAGPQDIRQSLKNLQKLLQQEIDQRKRLEARLASLEQDIKETSSGNTNQEESTAGSDNEAQVNPHQPGTFSQGGNWFNEQAMLDAGVDTGKVSYIKDAFEQAEMDRLYLRNQAAREGWINTDRYAEAVKEITDRTENLRSQLTEQEYDAYLYAAGRPNRVSVESVLSSSPASDAGIQAGDTILKYDSKRIYSWTDLTSATSEGNPNDTITVTIERDGQQQQVYIPRGPMGIRLSTDSVAP